MLKLPYWANDFLNTKDCPYCKGNMGNSFITHIGVKLHKDTKPCLYFESRCNVCEKIAHTTIFTDVNLTSSQIASEIYHGICGDSFNKNIFIEEDKKSIAFENEILSLKYYLQHHDDHNEFLKFIGLTDKEIKEYSEGEKEGEKEDEKD